MYFKHSVYDGDQRIKLELSRAIISCDCYNHYIVTRAFPEALDGSRKTHSHMIQFLHGPRQGQTSPFSADLHFPKKYVLQRVWGSLTYCIFQWETKTLQARGNSNDQIQHLGREYTEIH